MAQAARGGAQDIAEGSQTSATSKKTEIKLTNVAQAGLEELRLDYEDFLRQRGMQQWKPEHPALRRFRARRYASVDEVRAWVRAEWRIGTDGDTDIHGLTQTTTALGNERPCLSVIVRAILNTCSQCRPFSAYSQETDSSNISSHSTSCPTSNPALS